ncbi:MAG: sigma 54-interacting transcriptional regulator [Syntrophales bacterium]|nr:sigma 54-interacting transcriptional regulator [Syntrophales bacterium]
MLRIQDVLILILQEISEAAAIINQDYLVLYSNESFNKLYNFYPGGAKKKESAFLRQLDLQAWDSEILSALQKRTFPGGYKGHDIHVYLVYRSSREKYFLVLLKQPGTKAQKLSSYDHPVNPYIDDTIIQAGQLSPEFKKLIGEDIRFKRALLLAQRAARSDQPVLILGESGTGKEILARAIHRTSLRQNKQLVDVNCAAIPDTLIESELFGYERGAFTGARTEGRTGYFDEAHEGTILMDEIGDASLQTQSKLLRVLEDGSFKRVGGNRNVKVNVRIISSTNRELSKLVEEKKFREDLFYRLNTFTIQLPPLRERVNDIPLLVDHFLNSNSEREKKNFRILPSSMDIIKDYHWPGNVRELKSVVYYAVNLASGSVIAPSALPSFLFAANESKGKSVKPGKESFVSPQTHNLPEVMENIEKDMICEALKGSATKTEAIKKLGISRKTFYARIKQYGLEKFLD